VKALGLMSGTSAGGADAAIIEIRGAPPSLSTELLSFTLILFDAELRACIFVLPIEC
jgi:1,6-anhydro-N-acetylmuramate kinase